jgi:hypothetical protein
MQNPCGSFDVRDRKLLSHRISELGETEHQGIFNILSRNDISHTRNRNGVFVNLSTIPDDVLAQISAFVMFCMDNKVDLDEYEKRMNECKIRQDYHVVVGRVDPPPNVINEGTIDPIGTVAAPAAHGTDDNPAAGSGGGVKEKEQVSGVSPPPSGVSPPPSGVSPPPGSGGAPAAVVSRIVKLNAAIASIPLTRSKNAPAWLDLDKRGDSAKYMQAKKKYSKRRVESSTACSGAHGDELVAEEYIISHSGTSNR